MKLDVTKAEITQTLREQETAQVRKLMDDAGYNPIEAMMEMAQDEMVDRKIRLSLHKELAQYYAPKLKSVDVSHKGNVGIQVQVLRYTEDTDPDKLAEQSINGEVVPEDGEAIENDGGTSTEGLGATGLPAASVEVPGERG